MVYWEKRGKLKQKMRTKNEKKNESIKNCNMKK
jgi:hypothetical protein